MATTHGCDGSLTSSSSCIPRNPRPDRSLYGATVLQMAQAPLGLWHLHGSMQVLSDQLVEAIESQGGRVLMRHRVTGLEPTDEGWRVVVDSPTGRVRATQPLI